MFGLISLSRGRRLLQVYSSVPDVANIEVEHMVVAMSMANAVSLVADSRAYHVLERCKQPHNTWFRTCQDRPGQLGCWMIERVAFVGVYQDLSAEAVRKAHRSHVYSISPTVFAIGALRIYPFIIRPSQLES